MKKVCVLAAALIMAMAITVPAFADDTPPVDSAGTASSDTVFSLMHEVTLSWGSLWTSPEHRATPSNGSYIRYWHRNDTDRNVCVYLIRTDEDNEEGTTNIVSMMTVNANDQDAAVYYSPTSGSGTYKVWVEAYVAGGGTSGETAVGQYTVQP